MLNDSALRRRTLLAAIVGAAAVPIVGGPARAALPKVYIDPGHGGTDPGAVGNGLQEKALTLDISLQLRSILLAGWAVDVRMSRTTDITRSLAYRTDDANAWGADLFVSVHINSGGGTGFESYRYPTASAGSVNLHNALHPRVLAGMRSIGSVTDRGLKTANFHVLRETNMPAVLTENLFIDTLADANLLKRADFITATARGHAQGIASYLGLGSTNPPPTFSAIVDNATAGRFTASTNWGTSTYSSQRYGADYRFASPTPASDAAWFKVDIPAAGNYRIEVRHPADPGYSSSAPHVVVTAAGNQTVNLDQRSNGGVWRSLGTFALAAGDRNLVAVSRWTSAAGYVVADAVRVTRV